MKPARVRVSKRMRLDERVRELQAKLAESIPVAEAERRLKRAKARLRGKVKRLEERVAESMPRSEAEARIRDVESNVKALKDMLDQSLPRAEAEAAKAELQGKIVKLEAELAESVPRSETDQIRAEVEELQKELAASKSEADSLREQLAQLQARLVDSVPKAELEAKASELGANLWRARRDLELVKSNVGDREALEGELQSKVVDLETKLAASIPRTEADALVDRANRLEAALSETREKLDAADRKSRELEYKLSESVPRRELDAAKADAKSAIHDLQEKLSESANEAEALRQRVAELESRIVEAQKELEVARTRIRQLEAPSDSSSGHAVS